MILTKQDVSFIYDTIFEAGKIILDIYQTDFSVETKEDSSPLTIADQRANDFLVEQLSSRFPLIYFITEESKNAPYSDREKWKYTWIIDPLDGTKEFVKRNGEFTVNVALCHRSEIIFGAIYVPVTGEYYFAQKNQGAFKKVKTTVKQLTVLPPENELIVATSRSHRSKEVEQYSDQFKEKFNSILYLPTGSSLKMCLVAEGKAHIYPRLGPTMEWDIAAGSLIAQEAGAKVFSYPKSQPLSFNKPNLTNPFFVVSALH